MKVSRLLRFSLLCAVALSAGCTLRGSLSAWNNDSQGFSGRDRSSPKLKVVTRDAGLYRIPGDDLAVHLGVQSGRLPVLGLVLKNRGISIPHFRTGDGGLVFYAPSCRNTYTDQNVFSLEIGFGPDLPLVTVTPPSQWDTNRSHAASIGIEDRKMARPDLYDDPEDDFWLWSRLASDQRLNMRSHFNLPGLTPGSGGLLTAYVKGGGAWEHRVRIELNKEDLGYLVFTNAVQHSAGLPVPGGQWRERDNEVRFFCENAESQSWCIVYVDRFTVDYQRRLNMEDGQLLFSAAPGSVMITGLDGVDPEVWDITNPDHPERLQGVAKQPHGEGWALGFESLHEGRYVASCRFLEPVAIKPWKARDLKQAGRRVDYLVVSAPGLLEASQRLAGIRRSQGLRVEVIDSEEAYDNFNHGIVDPSAFADLLAYAKDHWKVSPRYVLLVGNGSLDFMNVLGQSPNILPASPAPVLDGGLHASDHRLADLDGDGTMEFAVGRLPASSPDEVDAYRKKVMAFEAGGGWRKRVLVVADNRDFGGNFERDADQLAGLIQGRDTERMDLGYTDVSIVSKQVVDRLNRGLEMLVFVGHGNTRTMAEEGILRAGELDALQNSRMPGIFVSVGCLMADYGSTGSPGLGVSLVTGEHGTSAFISSSVKVNNWDGVALADALIRAIYGKKAARLGDAWIQAQDAQNNGWVAETYQLLGDPALRLGR